MNLRSILTHLINHPLNRKNKTLSVLRFLRWQLRVRLTSQPFIHAFTEKSKIIVKRSMTGATSNLYCGLAEFDDMAFLLHCLRPQDFFLDIGANIGSYTILAAAHARARTIAVEPVPGTFEHLLDNVRLNNIDSLVTTCNIALGSKKGSIDFTNSFDTGNHVAIAGEPDIIRVPVETLDDLINGDEVPVLIKIDVEGFETEVLTGGNRILNDYRFKALIIELNNSGARYGYSELAIHEKLLGLGFRVCSYNPWTRSLALERSFSYHNTIYIRDLDFIRQRLVDAPLVKILGQKF